MERILEQPLDEIVAAHIRGCWARDKGDSLEAYKCQSMVVTSFAKLLGVLVMRPGTVVTVFACFRIAAG